MNFYRLNEVSPRNDGPVFKASSAAALIAFIIFMGTALGLLLYAICGWRVDGVNPPPSVFIYFFAAFALLFAAFAWDGFRAATRPSNWLLRCNNSGVIIKYRSFENWRFPATDIQAVALDYSEIAEVKIVKERRVSPGLGGGHEKQVQFLTFLTFHLNNPDTSALEARLQAEEKVEPSGNFRTKYCDYPVEVQPGGIVQLCWTGMHPGAHKAIDYLSRYLKIGTQDALKTDLTAKPNQAPDESDANILKLVKSGNKIGAVALARQIYGSTLTEATAYVDKLQAE